MNEKTLKRKWEGKLFLSVFGWVATKENKWWGPGVFFLLCVCVCAQRARVLGTLPPSSFFFFFSPLNDAFFFFFSFFRCPRLKVEHCLFSSSFYYYYYYYYYYLAVSVIVVLFFFFFFCLIRHDFFK